MGKTPTAAKADSSKADAAPATIPSGGSNLANLPMDKVSVKKGFNPRTDLGDYSALKANIKENGLAQPIVVCPTKPGADTYYVIAGHRRFACYEELNKKNIPVVIRDIDIASSEALALAGSENNDGEDGLRKGLTPLETAALAERMMKLLDTDDLKVVGKAIGYSAMSLGRYLKLKELPAKLQAKVQGGLSHLAALTVLDVPEKLRAKAADRLVIGMSEAEAQRALNDEKRKALGEDAVTPAEKRKEKVTVADAKKIVGKVAKKEVKPAAGNDELPSTHNRPWGQRPGVTTNPLGSRVIRDALLKCAKRALNSAVDIEEAQDQKDDAALAKARLAYATNAAYVAAFVWSFGEISGELPDIDSSDFKEVLVDVQKRLDAESEKPVKTAAPVEDDEAPVAPAAKGKKKSAASDE